MELDTITMPRTEARKAFADYRRAVHKRHDEEDAEIMRAYRQLAKGTQLIRLSDTVRRGGLTTVDVPQTRWNRDLWRDVPAAPQPVQVPRLAIARADVRFVWTSGVRPEGSCELRYTHLSITERSRQRHRLAPGTFETDDARETTPDWRLRIRAMAPNVPPALRPAHHLRNYHLLWEAEWEIDHSVPPGDPALLKHVSGDLYAVLAIWDLTPIEQAVLAGRTPEGLNA